MISLPGMLQPCRDLRRTILKSMAFALACLVLAAAAAESPLPRKPSPAHTPLVGTAAPTDAPGYREQLTGVADRYVQLYYSADLRGALTEARHGLTLAEQARNPADEAQFLKALGYVSWLLGDTAGGLDYEERLLTLADTLNDDRLRSAAHRTLGTIHRQLGDREKGRQHTLTALSLAERTGDEALRHGVLNNLAVFALDAGDHAEARRLHQQILAYREQQGEIWDIAGSVSNLADVATAERNFTEALALHERALALRQQIGDQRGIVRSLRQVAGALRALGRTDEALTRLAESLARAKSITGHELLRDIWQEITLTREARGEFALALAAEREAGKAREALAGERARLRIAELQARYDDARKQTTIQRLAREQHLQAAELRAQEAEIGRIRFRNLLLVSLLISGLLLLASIVWSQRARLRAERRARDAAEAADALKTKLVGMVSHDIRGPVGNILALGEDLRDDPATPAKEPRIQVIVHEAQHVLTLAQDLLDTAALEAGCLKLHAAPVDLATICRAALDRVTLIANAKGQRLDFHPSDTESTFVNGDATRLTQAATNLLSNAIKYSPRNTTIHIALSRQQDHVNLAVQDEGPGIPAASIPLLFRPFSPLSTPPTGGESSHGLGLSITHDLIRLHGGRILVDSALGRGSTFTISLPALA